MVPAGPTGRSARTSCTSVVRPSASTARREISSALPRQECLHGLDQSGRVLPGKHCLHFAGRPHRATPRSGHVRPRSAPRRSHTASTRPHARPRCDAPPPCGSTDGRPSSHSRHAGSAPPCRGATGPGRTRPRVATGSKHRPQVVRRLMSGEQDVRSAATHKPQARWCRRMTTHRRVLRAPCLRLPLASLLTMTRTSGLKLRRRSPLAGPDGLSRQARSSSTLGATAGRDRARPRRG